MTEHARPARSAETDQETGTLADHAAYLFFDFPCASHARRELLQLTPEAIDRHEGLGIIHPSRKRDTRAKSHIFQEGHLTLSNDLHDAAVAALAGARPGPFTRHDAACLRLSDRGRAVLNGDWARPSGDPRQLTGYSSARGLIHALSKESSGRSEAVELSIEIVDVIVLELADALGLIIVEVRLMGDDRPLVQLEEVLHAICHTRRRETLSWAAIEDRATYRFGLHDLVTDILRPVGCVPRTWNRIYTYTYAQTPRLPANDEATFQLWRLASHFTRAYHPGPEFADHTSFVRAFDDLIHMGSIEGAATLAGQATTFHKDGLRDRIRTNYLPLAMLAYHEQVQLLDLAQGVALFSPKTRLQSLLDRFLAIRIRLFLPVVSDVAAHTRFYHMLRAGLQSEVLTAKIRDDAAEMNRRLATVARTQQTRRERAQEARRRRRERAYAPVLGLFTGMLTFLTGLTALKEIATEFPKAFVGTEHMPLFLALLLGGASGLLATFRHRGAHDVAVEEAGQEELEEERSEELNTEAVLTAAEAAAHARH